MSNTVFLSSDHKGTEGRFCRTVCPWSDWCGVPALPWFHLLWQVEHFSTHVNQICSWGHFSISYFWSECKINSMGKKKTFFIFWYLIQKWIIIITSHFFIFWFIYHQLNVERTNEGLPTESVYPSFSPCKNKKIEQMTVFLYFVFESDKKIRIRSKIQIRFYYSICWVYMNWKLWNHCCELGPHAHVIKDYSTLVWFKQKRPAGMETTSEGSVTWSEEKTIVDAQMDWYVKPFFFSFFSFQLKMERTNDTWIQEKPLVESSFLDKRLQ